jgi:hypothetical protein
MTPEEVKTKFDRNIAYLQTYVKPDDIYAFAEETFSAAIYFLAKLAGVQNLNTLCEQDPVMKKWVPNIIALHRCKEANLPVELNLDLECEGPYEANY